MYTVYGFNLECSTALLKGMCATLNARIQALKLNHIEAGYLFHGYCFGHIMGSVKIAKIRCL